MAPRGFLCFLRGCLPDSHTILGAIALWGLVRMLTGEYLGVFLYFFSTIDQRFSVFSPWVVAMITGVRFVAAWGSRSSSGECFVSRH